MLKLTDYETGKQCYVYGNNVVAVFPVDIHPDDPSYKGEGSIIMLDIPHTTVTVRESAVDIFAMLEEQ